MQMGVGLNFLTRTASGINGLLGAWIMLSPLAFGFAARDNAQVWSSLVTGAIVMTFGMARLAMPDELPVLSWINLALGACILTSPWMLHFAANGALMWSDVAAGVIIMILAGLSAGITRAIREQLSRAGAPRLTRARCEQ
jgi:hypothetical protein